MVVVHHGGALGAGCPRGVVPWGRGALGAGCPGGRAPWGRGALGAWCPRGRELWGKGAPGWSGGASRTMTRYSTDTPDKSGEFSTQ